MLASNLRILLISELQHITQMPCRASHLTVSCGTSHKCHAVHRTWQWAAVLSTQKWWPLLWVMQHPPSIS